MKKYKHNPGSIVFGASGLLGQSLLAALKINSLAIGTFNTSPFIDGLYFNSLTDDLHTLLKKVPFCIKKAYLLYGITNINDCHTNYSLSQRINCDSYKRLIDSLVMNGIEIIYISSDAIFDGAKGNYSENDSANPALTYGLQKIVIENYLSESLENYHIIRLPKVLSPAITDPGILSEWIKLAISKKEIFPKFSPIFLECTNTFSIC